MNTNSSCLYSSIILLNNIGCRSYNLGLSRNAAATFKQAMNFVRSSFAESCSLDDIQDVISSSEKDITTIASSLTASLEISFDCMDFSTTLKFLDNICPNQPIWIRCDDTFFNPDSAQLGTISAIILYNISVALLTMAQESDVWTLQKLCKSCISFLQYSERILLDNGTSIDDENKCISPLDFCTPIVDVVHALIASRIYNISKHVDDEDMESSDFYKENMEGTKKRAKRSVATIISSCGSFVTRQGSPAA
jgi:hypothetical protein